MSKIVRSALKGYTYQQYVFTYFLAKMDTLREITKIESESIIDSKFDDLYIMGDNNYRIQVKNYPNTTLEDIVVTDQNVIIKSNSNRINKDENNVLIVNTSNIMTDSKFMGLPATVVDDITIIPLLTTDIENDLDNMFSTEIRELQIVQLAYRLTVDSKFEIIQEELPELVRISTNLEEQTLLIREPIKKNEKGILWIQGRPGVGKSHYVDELTRYYSDAIIYRFWVGSQDEKLFDRLHFNLFLKDIALGVFKSPKNFSVKELSDYIVDNDIMLIIDGLDHVENYNPKELALYLDFINTLNNANVIVLSRPLVAELDWEKIELPNWTSEETLLYLSLTHNITDFNIAHEIFSVTDGYPIITFFIAQHYNIYHEINVEGEVSDINNYYDKLLEEVQQKSSLTVFATNNSFFLISEIKMIINNPVTFSMIDEFIKSYPYLFRCVLNRVSLIHDSFNTYLRKQLTYYGFMEEKVNAYVKESLIVGEPNFMARFTSFNLGERFIEEILLKYCKVDEFEMLLDKTLDYNSIISFYNQLHRLLEYRENIIDIYGYYSFSLIYQVISRNNLTGYDELIYQILVYMKKYSTIEEEIFSSGIMWNIFVLLRLNDDTEFRRYLSNHHNISNEIDSVHESIEKESEYFEVRMEKPNHEEVIQLLEGDKIYGFDRQDVLVRYLINIWFEKDKDNSYFKLICEYINGNENVILRDLENLVEKYGIERRWASRIFSSVVYQLNELGEFNTNNIFLEKSLLEIIVENASGGSFGVAEYARSFVRLANHKEKEIDIYSVNRVWAMYFERKDYSVYTLDILLRLFEDLGLIKDDTSILIIKKVMKQSEKGIRHLMNSYLNKKSASTIKKLDLEKAFINREFPADVFELNPDKINCISQVTIDYKIHELLNYHKHSMSIDYDEICFPLKSKYSERLLEAIYNCGYKIIGKIEDEKVLNDIEEKHIEFVGEMKEKTVVYRAFEHGCIHVEDFQYIEKNKIDIIEVSKYTDVSNSCFPFVDLYEIYNIEEVKSKYMKVIHQGMFAKVQELESVGNWHLLLGNIPQFLMQYEIEVNWDKLFELVRWYLKISLIYDGSY